MKHSDSVFRFLNSFRRRLTLRAALHSTLWCLVCGGLVALIYSLVWRVQGRAVPTDLYPVLVFWLLVVAVMAILVRRLDKREAAREADQHFGLKDGLSSTVRFSEEGREGEVYELQSRQVEEQLKDKSPSSLPLRWPWGLAWSAVGLIALSSWLATLPNSAAVQSQLDAEQVTLEKSVEAQEALKELMEELIEELDEDELAEVDVEEMREWVKSLEETKDQKESLRQLARFEQKIAKTLQGLEAREDEQTLKLAAAELGKSDLSDARQLGKKLDQNEFKEAAMNLKELKPDAKDAQGRKLTEDERKEMLKKLREATKRMANGAKNRNNKAQGKQAPQNGQEMMPMDQLLDELDQAAEDFDAQMANLQEIEGEFEPGEFDDKLARFFSRMNNLDARKRLRGKLKAMQKNVGQCQSFCAGGAQQLGLGKGGLKPGQGSVASRREGETEMPNQMNAERLKGQKGKGPSQSTVEDADSGTGVSGRRAAAKARSFDRQMESFVQRDDIPEAMKLGVREYFERVHEVESKTTETP